MSGVSECNQHPLTPHHTPAMEVARRMAKSHSSGRKPLRETMAPDLYAAYIEKQRLSSTGRKHRPESIEKMREFWKGRQFPPLAHERARAVNAGRPLTEEHKQKIREAMKGMTRTVEHQEKLNEAQRGRPKSVETRQKISRTLAGRDGRPHEQPAKDAISEAQRQRWADRRSPVSRSSVEYKAWRAAVLKRDGGACRECGIKNVLMHCHHIKPFLDHPELRYDAENGLTMCARCHAKAEGPLAKLQSQIKRARTILRKLVDQGVDMQSILSDRT